MLLTKTSTRKPIHLQYVAKKNQSYSVLDWPTDSYNVICQKKKNDYELRLELKQINHPFYSFTLKWNESKTIIMVDSSFCFLSLKIAFRWFVLSQIKAKIKKIKFPEKCKQINDDKNTTRHIFLWRNHNICSNTV